MVVVAIKKLLIKALHAHRFVLVTSVCISCLLLFNFSQHVSLLPDDGISFGSNPGPLLPQHNLQAKETDRKIKPSGVRSLVHSFDLERQLNKTSLHKVRHLKGPLQWKDHIVQACDDNGLPRDRANFTLDALKHVVVDDTHKVLFCPIPSVASTTWVRILLALTGKINLEETFRMSSKDIHSRWGLLNYLSHYSRGEILDRLRNYYKFVIVRDPYERLLCTYRNKFERPANLTGFHFVYGKSIVRDYRPGRPWKDLPTNKRYEPTFSEYLTYVSDPHSNILRHNSWETFSSLCQPCVVQYDFVSNLANMKEDVKTILKKVGVSLSVPNRDDMGYRHKRTGDVLSNYFSNISNTVMNSLYHQYRLDFEIFNMTLKNIP